MERVVITGMGLISALGADAPACWQGLIDGRSGIRPISQYDATAYATKVAGEAVLYPRDNPLPELPWQWCRRALRLFLKSAREAFQDAGLDREPLPPREIGIAAAATVNWIDVLQLQVAAGYPTPDGKGFDTLRYSQLEQHPVRGYYKRMGDLMAAVPARVLGLAGPCFVTDTACAASAHTIGEAYRLIKRGKVRAMVAGGAAALVNPIAILAFALIGALTRNGDPETASRPFDRNRDGFVMGEAAGTIVLESLSSARARGARIYAELSGFGTTLNAGSLTDPSPDGAPEARAITLALQEAGLRPEEIGYVAAHGTSTLKNDLVETLAIKRVFGDRASRIPVSSNKGQLGHTISAAGVCNVIAAAKAISTGVIPPTMHLVNPDPACDLDYVPNHSRQIEIQAAVTNAFAFGGQNAVLALKACNA
ncbi:MAG: beta-ketoacyl-[acyl-carrier-protein] synthase family protein [Proteobacteria bacterium]|nr:beta-ketoacyl-[acyl-carrier-protein] synthase family protein [Pseudomonadota bacterium]